MKSIFSKLPLVALAVMFFAGMQMYAQQATTAMKGLTPSQLQNGSAQLVGHYNSTQTLRLVIGLQHPHLAEEDAFVESLQTKGSPNFQKFLTAAQWNARFSPSVADEQAVVDWATSQGMTVSHRFPNRLLVDIEAPASVIEKAFGVTINAYTVDTRAAFSNDRDPVIPASMAKIIHSVGGLNSIQVLKPHSKMPEPAFADYSAGPVRQMGLKDAKSATAKRPVPVTNSSKSAAGPKANITGGAYDPSDIYSQGAYDVNALYAQGHCCNPLGNAGVTPPESSIAIATAGVQSGNDFAGFNTSYPYLAYHYQQIYVDGTPSCCDGEGTLDFDWSTAWSNSFGSYVDTSMIYMYDGVNNSFSTFTDVYNQILTDQNAKVFSTSWGCEETACTPNSVMDTDHGIFNSMVGQGMTLVAASGDQGATAGCGDAVAVQYPASDPDIVGAGGTTLYLNSNDTYDDEVAWSGGPYGCGSNDGGSTGGASSYYAKPSYQNGISGLGTQRYVPDIALNADWYNTPQNFYFGGSLQGNGGTSIVAPSVAGFFANTNAYLDYVATVNGGCYGASTCAPIGNGNFYLYWFGENNTYAPHYPFYDITSGCNNNDETAYYGLGYYCAATGYDPVTGWGSFNALQLARAITTYRAGDFVSPTASFSGYTQPVVNQWYNTDQTVQWTVSDAGQSGLPATGVAGYTQAWDTYINDSTSELTPGSGDAFYSGPQFPNATYGAMNVSAVGQGCHTAQIRSWDNSGFSGYQTYGPVCYDTVAPVSAAVLSGSKSGVNYTTGVTVTLSATDASSGVKTTYYNVDGGSYVVYSGAFLVGTVGNHTVNFYSTDVAGNSETIKSVAFNISTLPVASTPLFTPAPGTYQNSPTVHISSTTPGASIYYTINGIMPSTSSSKYTTGVLIPKTETLEAIAVAPGYKQSAVASGVYNVTPTTATPVISPVAGTYTTAKTVTIADATSGAAIYYTLNGTNPTTASTLYTAGFKISSNTTVKAIAAYTGYNNSVVATSVFTLTLPAGAPVFSIPAGTYTTSEQVHLTSTTPSASFYYTTDGTTPTTSSTKYNGVIVVTKSETITAFAISTGSLQSPITSAKYIIAPYAATPIIAPAAGTYTTEKTITITDATAGSNIYYTTNGTTPTTGSTHYLGAFKIIKTSTVQAIAVASGFTASHVASAAYTINLPTAAPTISPAAGTYATAKTISMTDATTGAAIYYTVDGSTPTTSSTPYTGSFKVSQTTTVKAIALASGYTLSPVSSSTYTIP